MITRQYGRCNKMISKENLVALKRLAQRGAYAVCFENEGQAIVQVRSVNEAHKLEQNGARIVCEIETKQWAAWVQAGWVVRDDGVAKEAWRISNAGRLCLKRQLTRTNTPQKSAVCRDVKTQPKPSLAGSAAQKRKIPYIGAVEFNDAESPLTWLRRRKGRDGAPYLSDAQFIAGERLRSDFWFAQMTPRVTSNWSPISQGRSRGGGRCNHEADQLDAISEAGERVRAALKAVGPELSSVLVDVCCHLKGLESVEKASGWPQRSGKIVLRMALTALARHYGLTFEPQQEAGHEAAIRKWATPDHRPSLDKW